MRYGQDVDICLLGIGGNGHIAFNEPGSSFESETRVVDLTEQTIQDNSRFFPSIDDVPTKAITMGLKPIMSSKRIILMANGKHKKIYYIKHYTEKLQRMFQHPFYKHIPT